MPTEKSVYLSQSTIFIIIRNSVSQIDKLPARMYAIFNNKSIIGLGQNFGKQTIRLEYTKDGVFGSGYNRIEIILGWLPNLKQNVIQM